MKDLNVSRKKNLSGSIIFQIRVFELRARLWNNKVSSKLKRISNILKEVLGKIE